MELKDIYGLLKEVKIPIAYDHFDSDKDIKPPFVAYREKIPDVFKADNKNYASFLKCEIELVTDKKDVVLERKISDLLDNNSISYEKNDEIWDENEKIYHIFYEI